METVAKLSLKHITCHHNIPDEFGVRKINTLGYHPKTDSLVEKFTYMIKTGTITLTFCYLL